MNILFLSPPNISAGNIIRDAVYGCWCQGKRIAGAQTPPYPLLLLATVLRREGHKARVIDACAQGIGLDKLAAIVKEYDILVIISSVMTFFEDSIIFGRMKEANKGLITIVAGAQSTFLPELTLKNSSVDIIVRREPEFIIRDLINAMQKPGAAWHSVKGIGYKTGEKNVINDFYPLIENLDELPFVDWNLLEVGSSYFNPIIKNMPYVTDLTTRGCYANCTFCMSPSFYGNKIRARSAQNVLEGFRRHVSNGFKEVYLRDEMFTAFTERNRAICETMIAEKIPLTWICSARIGSVDRPMLELMKRAGCHTIKFGVESGVQELLDNVKKGITLKETEDVFLWCKKLGIRTHAHFMVGLPGESRDTLKRTMAFAKKISPVTATFGMFTPYPGTKIFEEIAKDNPGIKQGLNMPVKDLHTVSFFTDKLCKLSAKELSESVVSMHRQFYLRPGYIFSWLGRIRSLKDLKNVSRAGLSLFDFSLRGE